MGPQATEHPDLVHFRLRVADQHCIRNSTAGNPIAAIPVRVSTAFGYIRTWNDRSPSGFTALGLRKPGPGEQASTINGVLYAIEGDDMTKFDAREAGYARVEVPHADIEAVSWQSTPSKGHIWVYVPVRPGGAPGIGLPQADAAFPLLELYIDVVVEGGLEYGPEFARELIETTADWSPFWLNDRELARRPWVHDSKYALSIKCLPGSPRQRLNSRTVCSWCNTRCAGEKKYIRRRLRRGLGVCCPLPGSSWQQRRRHYRGVAPSNG